METVVAVQSAENGHSGVVNGHSGFVNGSSSPFVPSPPPPSSTCSVFKGKIEFHLARKPFTGFINSGGGGDFRIETLNPDSGRKRPPGDLDSGGQPWRKVDGSDFLENGLDPELSFEISFRKIGAGLENLGNTCFLNSVLQCLTYTEPLAAYLQSGKHQNSCHIAGFCALCAIQKHVSRALQSTGRSLIPKDLVSNLRCISRNFRNARQEDAHEYMVNLLESMHKCCLPLGVPIESPAAYEKSLVHKIFGGRLCSQVECQQCFYSSNKFDPFLDLSLEIVKADSLPVALRNFTAAEMLDGGEKHYQCQKCKQKVRAKKRLTVHKAPYVLTIHLKRFHAHDPGRKVDKKVLFNRSLDMKPFVSDSYDGDLKYSLYGVLVHYGHNTHSGHYVCFVRTSSGMWYLLNDNEVRQVSEKHVLDQKAYMLFYVRDRKNVAQRKPIDFQKENIKAAFSNNANLVQKSFLKENSSFLIHGSRMAGYFATDKKDACNVGPLKQTFAKEASSQCNNGAMISECSVPKEEPVLGPSISAPLLKDMSKSDSSGSPGSIFTERAAGNVLNEQASGVGQEIAHELVISSIPLVVPNECSIGEASESRHHKKSKKKVMKYQILRMHVGSNLFRASLGLWKKKKHKKSKKHISCTRNLVEEQLLDSSFASELGPSTSTSKVSVGSVNSQMKVVKSGLEASLRKFGNVPVGDIINGELSERNNQNGVARSTDEQKKGFTSIHEANQHDSRDPDAAEHGNRDASQKGMMDILDRDVMDIGVARWDGTVLPPSETAEPSVAQNFSIGYVPDEWDEEYDQGKRKKLKHSKHNFGGPNPFQEIASKKAQFKEANIKRSSRGNQPFRI